jgi:hypothetical protein
MSVSVFRSLNVLLTVCLGARPPFGLVGWSSGLGKRFYHRLQPIQAHSGLFQLGFANNANFGWRRLKLSELI